MYATHGPCLTVTHGVNCPRSQAIEYLAADWQPTSKQTAAGVTKLVKALAPYDLTKGEKLQIVNLAPSETVELYVVRPRTLLP